MQKQPMKNIVSLYPGTALRTLLPPLWLACCCAAVLPAPALAAPEPGEEVITVAAPADSPLTTVISPKAPRQPVPASDGADLLKSIPGFALIRNGGSNGDPVLRGMFGSRLNILTDGGALYGGCGSRMDAPTSYISPTSFDLLSVIKGPQTVLWGPMAPAGTLLFEHRQPTFSQSGLQGEANTLFGSHGRADQNVDATLGSQEGYLRVSGGKSRASDYRDGNGDRVPGYWSKWNADATLGWTPDADSLAELSIGSGDGEARYAGRGMDGTQFLRRSASVRLEKRNIGEYLDSVTWQAYYNHADHIMDNYRLRQPPRGMKMSSHVDRATYGARLTSNWQWRVGQLAAGLDAQSSTHRKESAADGWQKDAQFRQNGVFAEWRTESGPTGNVIAGARLDNVRADDFRRESQSRSELLKGGFARYEQRAAGLPLMSYIGLGYTERFPDYWELFSGRSGNPDINSLRSEKTAQLDIGAQYKTAALEAWVSAYVGRIDNYILFDYRSPASQARNVNARTLGGELGGAYNLSEHWKTETSLAYSWGQNLTDHAPLPQMPPLDARLTLGYHAADWSSALLWRLVSAQHRVAIGQGNVAGQDLDASPGFGVLSWNADYIVSMHTRLSMGIDNLLNKQYAEHLNMAGNKDFGFPGTRPIAEPGRTIWGSLHVAF
ncbi:Colicin I receptor precursor [Serratia ficaria]|uniref:TonB-dependent copper receptor n=1 Tax=Serratia ficaria TaxID=61651 RepID=UPI00217BD526|nr:TonB-dependent copper receptor [Serratia ficaria]CAI1710805.1 Colicin I receptor precursor [Serratia ficaria]